MIFLKQKLKIIETIVMMIVMLISVLHQLYAPKSKVRLINEALDNSNIVNIGDDINGKICDITKEHDFIIYIFCNYKEGYYFSNEKNKIERIIEKFIKNGETRIFKESHQRKVYFINNNDTLEIMYEVNPISRVLEKGNIIP